MRVETLPPVAGWYWLRDGLGVIGRRPGLLPSLLVIMLMFVLVIHPIRYAGPLIAALISPCFTMVLMDACRRLHKNTEYFIDFQRAFNRRLTALLLLGFVEFLISQLALWATALLDNGVFINYLKSDYASASDQAQAFNQLYHLMNLPSAQLWIVLVALQKLLFWYVPLLVAWQSFSIGKAMFFNYYAFRRNWKPFLVYGGLIFLFMNAIALFILSIAIVSTSSVLILGVAVLIFAIIPIFVNSIYTSYSQIFLTDMSAQDTTSSSNGND